MARVRSMISVSTAAWRLVNSRYFRVDGPSGAQSAAERCSGGNSAISAIISSIAASSCARSLLSSASRSFISSSLLAILASRVRPRRRLGEPSVAMLVALARAARTILVAAYLSPGRRIVRIPHGRGGAGDATARERLAARHGQRHLVLAGRRVDFVGLHEGLARRRL